MKVLVTDAHYKNALAAVRALASEGVEVHAASSLADALSFYSKHVTKRFIFPDPLLRKPFVSAMEATKDKENYDAILPMGNESWYSVATVGSEELKRLIPMPPIESYLVAWDKLKSLRLARDLGIPVPRTIFPEECYSEERIRSMQYPLVAKRAHGTGGMSLIYDAKDAVAYHWSNQFEENPFVIQEYVHGDGYGFFGLYNKGKLLTFFMHRRLRETPPSGGPSSAAKSIFDPRLFALGSKILDSLSWHGVAMVEFRGDSETGDYSLLEINPKFWGSLDLAVSSGVNFPYLAACMVAFGEVAPVKGYRRGLEYCWPVPDDARHLLARPSSWRSVLADWVDFRVKKNIWMTDLLPHLVRLSEETAKRAKFHKLKSALSAKPQMFSWVIPGQLAGSEKPRTSKQLGWLGNKVCAILDLTEECPIAVKKLRRFGWDYLRIPMRDKMPPVLMQAIRSVDFISEKVSHGDAVLVCCDAGLGRTGTVLACYFVERYQMEPESAIREIRRSRPGSIEAWQESTVVTYSKFVNRTVVPRNYGLSHAGV